MYETYRMLGRAHEDELERMAAKPHGTVVTRERVVVRLRRAISMRHSTLSAETHPTQSAGSPSNAADAAA
jgi:hypothetical protein